ncbi:MAG: hypothetical protein ABFD69_15470 [Candidatus Sumerlaeia bacterium]
MSIAGGQFHVTHSEQERMTRGVVGFGSVASAILGGVGVIFCVYGLAGLNAATLAPLATILVGLSMMIGGGSFAVRTNKLGQESNVQGIGGAVGGEMAVESVAGILGAMLGTWALLGIQPVALMAVAAIVMGGGMLIESIAEPTLGRVRLATYRENQPVERFTHQAIEVSAGVDLVFGLGAISLGILALAGFIPMTVILMSMLTLGVGVLLGGSALAGRFLGAFK